MSSFSSTPHAHRLLNVKRNSWFGTTAEVSLHSKMSAMLLFGVFTSIASSLLYDISVRSSLVYLATFSALVWLLNPHHRHHGRRLPPGPRGWPILGYLPSIKFSEWWYGFQTHDVMCKLAEKYGAVFGLKIGSKDVLVLNDYESIKEAFHHVNMNDRPENAMIKDIDNLGTGR